MNTEAAVNGSEIYTNKLYQLTDEYIRERLNEDEKKVNSNFRDLIFYLADRISKPDNSDIESLDAMFSAFTRLCARYGRLPTLEAFSWLVGIDRNTFTDWREGRYRLSTAHGSTVKKWLDICKGFVVDELSNSKFANPNLIFTAKAAYYMRETAPIPATEVPGRIASQTPDEIARKYGIEYKSDCKIEFPEVPE